MNIKKLIATAGSLVMLSTPAFALWQGKLDLNLNLNHPLDVVQSQGFGYFDDHVNGQDLAMTLTPLWHLQHNDHEAFHVALMNAWNFPRNWEYSAFGISVGISLDSLGGVLSAPVAALLAKALPDVYPGTQSQVVGILNHIGNVLSIEGGGGYRLLGHTKDVKPWIGGWGVKLNIPISDILPKWINGGNG